MSCYRTAMALFQTDLCSNHKPVRSRGLYQWVGRGSTANNGLYLGEGDHSHDLHMFVSPVVTRGMSRIHLPGYVVVVLPGYPPEYFTVFCRCLCYVILSLCNDPITGAVYPNHIHSDASSEWEWRRSFDVESGV
jgi:hypothetical protein